MHVWHGRSRPSQSHLLILDSEDVPLPRSCRARAVTSHPAPVLLCALFFCLALFYLRGFYSPRIWKAASAAPSRLCGAVSSSSVLPLPLRPTAVQFCLVLVAVDLQSRAPVWTTAQLDRALEPVRLSRPEPVFPSRLSSPLVLILPWPRCTPPCCAFGPDSCQFWTVRSSR